MKSENEYTNMCLSSDIAYGQVNKQWGALFVLLHDCECVPLRHLKLRDQVRIIRLRTIGY